MSEDVKAGLGIFGVMLLFIIVLIFVLNTVFYMFKVHVNQTNIVSVKTGGAEVFRGKSAFVDVDSGGYTTTVTIYKQLYPFSRIQAVYSLKDITIKPAEDLGVVMDTDVVVVK